MLKIRVNDEVIVTAGKSKGHVGRVLRRAKDRLYVEGANIVVRHVKANPQAEEPGGRKEVEAPLHVSNVALYNPDTRKGDRVGIKVNEDGAKVRVFKSSGKEIEAS